MSETYLGIDIHKNWCVFAEIDSEGNLLRRGKFRNNSEELTQFTGTLTPGTKLVLEPVLNYLWMLDFLEPFASSVHVATPHKVRIIAESKRKSDRYDARVFVSVPVWWTIPK